MCLCSCKAKMKTVCPQHSKQKGKEKKGEYLPGVRRLILFTYQHSHTSANMGYLGLTWAGMGTFAHADNVGNHVGRGGNI